MSRKPMSEREIDALIAEKVFGGHSMVSFCCPECGGSHFGTGPNGNRRCHDEHDINCRWSGEPGECVPKYSTDIASAWTVVENMIKSGWNPTANWHDELDGSAGLRQWHACLSKNHHDPDGIWIHGYGETAPMAICQAALKAVGAEVP